MATERTVLRVFVSSPSDLTQERSKIKEVIEEVNDTLVDLVGVGLEAVMWEKDVAPGFGTDPQDVVNRSVGSGYDIFVGMLWTRFGTPTPRAGSGTEEEFDLAYERLGHRANVVPIMVYFKHGQIDPMDIDPDQLGQVKAFKERVGDLGGLTGEFDDIVDFEKVVRRDLTKVAVALSRNAESKTATPEAGKPNASVGKDRDEHASIRQEDAGLLDLQEEFAANMRDAAEDMDAIETEMEKMTRVVDKATEGLKAVNRPGSAPSAKELKRIVNDAATGVDSFAAETETRLGPFSEKSKTALRAYARFGAFVEDFPAMKDDLEGARPAIRLLHSAVATVLGATTELRDTMAEVPPMTTRMNAAKRRAVNVLDRLGTELTEIADLVSRAETALDTAAAPAPRREVSQEWFQSDEAMFKKLGGWWRHEWRGSPSGSGSETAFIEPISTDRIEARYYVKPSYSNERELRHILTDVKRVAGEGKILFSKADPETRESQSREVLWPQEGDARLEGRNPRRRSETHTYKRIGKPPIIL